MTLALEKIKKVSRRKIGSNNWTDAIKCFIYNKEDNITKLRQVQTLTIESRLKLYAIGDTSLLARLSGNDLASQEANYHMKCLNTIHNKAGKLKTSQKEQSQSQSSSWYSVSQGM